MKNTKSIKTIALITVLSLVISAMVGMSVFAADTAEAAITVDQTNIAYNEMMHIAFNLKVDETLGAGEKLGILVWYSDVTDELTAENASYKSFDEKVDDGGTKYFKSAGIPAPRMGEDLRVAGCIMDANGNIRIGTVLTYSIVDYLNSRIATEGITPAQLDLYKKTLAYGKAAGAVFAD